MVGTDNLKCDATFKAQFEDYLRTKKQVDPAQYEIITIAFCTGHSFVYTREIPDGALSTLLHVPMQGLAAYAMVLTSAMPRAFSDRDWMWTMV